MILAIILFIIGLSALLGGAKLLVFGASQFAQSLNISSLIIGLTIVSFGTSAPEIGISIIGAWRGEGGLVIGNIVGSNNFNILLVLGMCASVTPLVIKKQLIWWDVPIMILASLFFWFLTSQHTIGHLGGALLFTGLIAYLIFAFTMLKEKPPQEGKISLQPIWLQWIWIVLGLIFLGIGSEVLISGATKIARLLSISELLIGLTVVAIGTSLPELATMLMALRKGDSDMAVGNVVGSNLFNLLGVIGIAALVSPNPIEVPAKAISFDIPIMVGVAIATLPIFLTGHLISRWEGLLFLFYYFLYILFLILEARFIYYLSYFTTAFFFFILPLTILTLCVGVVRHYKQKR